MPAAVSAAVEECSVMSLTQAITVTSDSIWMGTIDDRGQATKYAATSAGGALPRVHSSTELLEVGLLIVDWPSPAIGHSGWDAAHVANVLDEHVSTACDVALPRRKPQIAKRRKETSPLVERGDSGSMR